MNERTNEPTNDLHTPFRAIFCLCVAYYGTKLGATFAHHHHHASRLYAACSSCMYIHPLPPPQTQRAHVQTARKDNSAVVPSLQAEQQKKKNQACTTVVPPPSHGNNNNSINGWSHSVQQIGTYPKHTLQCTYCGTPQPTLPFINSRNMCPFRRSQSTDWFTCFYHLLPSLRYIPTNTECRYLATDNLHRVALTNHCKNTRRSYCLPSSPQHLNSWHLSLPRGARWPISETFERQSKDIG